jgi:hypothetical protein
LFFPKVVELDGEKAGKIVGQRQPRASSSRPISGAVEWYFANVFGRGEGPGVTPFYCDPARVGTFAVNPKALANGNDASLFRLFVAMAMFQARRDVVIMEQQRTMQSGVARMLISVSAIERTLARHGCAKLATPEAFDEGCSVQKIGNAVDCDFRPGTSCHVKDATTAFNRMGDMGKLPTSAWLHIWRRGGLNDVVASVIESEAQPTMRATLLVERFARVYRVGRKLATMFVSALSVPALAPGLTPWFPTVDGNELVIVDTNVARAIDALSGINVAKTYGARERWVREQSARIDLRRFHPGVPSYSPRLVQQALYAFCSRSNRIAMGDACAGATAPCDRCTPALCPFVA